MDRPIIALDFQNTNEIWDFLAFFPKDEKLFVKVGMELFYKYGPDIVNKLANKDYDIFLDLKLHDIPNTVKQAIKALKHLDISMLNVHAAGGLKMMQSAKEALLCSQSNKEIKLIAVTQLTSTSQLQMQNEQLILTSLENSVLNYAKLAKQANLDGVVCSAYEARKIKELLGYNFLCVTPGIRLKEDNKDDQIRVADPFDAKKLGSSYIVVGRSITKSLNPYKSYLDIKKQWNQGDKNEQF